MSKRCTNKVSQWVLVGFSYKEIKLPCGSIGVHGQKLLCDDCVKAYTEQYPQGWCITPGDTCKHGFYVGDEFGPDRICPKCEDDEE